jgi:hypothetical protein
MADLILYPFFLSLILALLYVTWRLVIYDIRTSLAIKATATLSIEQPLPTIGY